MQRMRCIGLLALVALLLTGSTLSWAQETGSSNLSWDREPLQGTGVKSLLVSGNKWQLADSSTEELTRKLLEPARGVELLTC